MKKIINVCLILLLAWMSATAQDANPFISMGTFPAVVSVPSGGGAGGNSTLQVSVGNAGNDNIVMNSLEVTITVGPNAEILEIGAGSDTRWTLFSLTPGAGGTIKLRNTGAAPFGPFDVGVVNITIRGVAAGANNIQGNVAYLLGPNPALGGAPSISQGNTSNTDDNATAALIVSSVAPVVLEDVSAIGNSCNGIITWKTSGEQNVDRFEIEFGTNLLQMSTIGTVAAKNSPTGATYNYVNAQGTARGYYRLKMIDRDGQFQYSKIVVVDTKCNGKKNVTLYPNPLTANHNLTVITSGFEGQIKGDLYSMSGQLIRTYVLINGNNSLPVDKVAQGTYTFRVVDAAGDTESFRIVIAK